MAKKPGRNAPPAQAKSGETPAPAASAKPAEPAKVEPENPAAAQPPKQPEKPPAEDVELQLSRALGAVRQKETENVALRKAAGEGARAAKELEALRKRARSPEDVLDVLQEVTGMDFEQLGRAILDGSVKPPKGQRYANLPPEVVRQLEEQDRQLKEITQERETYKQQQARQQDEARASSFIRENAQDFPLLASAPWAAATIVQTARQQGTNDASEIIVALEQSLRANLESLLSNEAALDAVFGSNDKLRERLVAKYGQPAASNGRGKEGGNGSVAPSPVSESAFAGSGNRTRAEIDEHASREFARHMAAKGSRR